MYIYIGTRVSSMRLTATSNGRCIYTSLYIYAVFYLLPPPSPPPVINSSPPSLLQIGNERR